MISKYNPAEVQPGFELFLNHTVSTAAKTFLLYIQHVGHHYFKGNRLFYERKEYKSFHLVFTLGGKGHLYLRNKNYDIVKGQLMFINCMEYHIMSSDAELGWHYKWIHFDGFNAESLYSMIYEKYGPVMDFGSDTFIPNGIDNLIEMVLSRDINIEIKASNIITGILTYVFLNGNSGTVSSNDANSKIKAVIDFIEKNYASDIGINDLVRIACYSKYHFSRLFKAITGYNPYEYIIKYRINTAKTLLKSTVISVEEISETVGFDTSSNFIYTFKKLEGITPSKFRKALTNSVINKKSQNLHYS
ncbi:MAG: AraC family transcriptional regulator [Ruminiclostridium sp.]|nr:AraC family transcriptional regulator [Ruminiclostridium sp.]